MVVSTDLSFLSMFIVIFVQRGAQGVTFPLPVRWVPEEAKQKRGKWKMENGLDTALGYVWIGERSFFI